MSKELKIIKRLANKIGAVLIFDEIATGFRMCSGGIHKLLKINPDLCFCKIYCKWICHVSYSGE